MSVLDPVFNELLEYPRTHCQPVSVDSVLAPLLILVRYANIFITACLYAMSLRFHEIYLFFFSVGLTLDAFVNVALVALIQGAVPILGCGGPYDMPSVIAQHAGFFVVSILTYSYQYRSPHIHTLHHALLAGWALLVPFTMAFFNFNSAAQLLVGFLVGSLLGFIWQVAIVFPLLVPRFPTMLRWRVVHALGYQDTMCQIEAARVLEDLEASAGYAYVPAAAAATATTTRSKDTSSNE